MHIVYVTGDFAKRPNVPLTGMPNYIYKISKYMISRGHRVETIVPGNRNRIWNYGGVTVYTRELLRFGGILENSVAREKLFNSVIEEINEKEKVDLVQYAGWNGVGMLYSGKYPSVLRISTYSKLQLRSRFSSKDLFLLDIMERLAARRFDRIVSPSRALGVPFSQAVNRSVDIIETPLEINEIEEDDSVYREFLGGKDYVLFFGRVSSDKGIYTIANGIHELLDAERDLYFCVCGEIASLKHNPILFLKEKAGEFADRVVYCGNLRHRQLYPIIRNAKCVVMPSLMDNIPNAGLEAMALNGLVIGTRGASFDEMFRDGVSGFLMDVDDHAQMVKRIREVYHMDEEDKERIKQGAKDELRRYDVSEAGHKLEQYYNNLIHEYEERNISRR